MSHREAILRDREKEVRKASLIEYRNSFKSLARAIINMLYEKRNQFFAFPLLLIIMQAGT